jgi:hypothetical protein
MSIDLAVTVGRLRLKNPVICAAGEHVLTAAGVRAGIATGAAVVVAKSVNETQAAREQLARTDYALLGPDWQREPWPGANWRDASLLCRSGLRLLCNHPTYVVDATHDDIRRLVGMGVYVEHSVCMFIPGSKFKFYDPPELDALIGAGTVERTILGSDLGQQGNPRLVDGFRNVIETCLDLGYAEPQIRRLVSANAAELIGL